MLYGNKDLTKTLEISTRCGQDADCNPSSAGGILCTVLGYKNIPAYWKMGLKEAEDIHFKYTTMSLNAVYRTGFKHALENIKRNGGTVTKDNITIKPQAPTAVRFEKSFEGLYPKTKFPISLSEDKKFVSFDFEGTGFVIRGETARWGSTSDFVFQTELYVDGKLVEKPLLPASYITRRYELAWKYDLPFGKHKVELKILNHSDKEQINVWEALIYTNKPIEGVLANEKAEKSMK